MGKPMRKRTKKERAKIVGRVLNHLFPDPKISLRYKDPYTLLIAVLLSAQCTDVRVNEVTPRLFALADTPQAMVQLTPEQIEEMIRPCGLSSTKAKNIWKLSRDLILHHRSLVPRTLPLLEELPGVGHKTASVVLSQAFGRSAFPVDTHIHRCAHRWGLSSGKSVEQTEKDLKRLFPRSRWKRLHLQMISFARQYCPARGHRKEKCPICLILNETIR